MKGGCNINTAEIRRPEECPRGPVSGPLGSGGHSVLGEGAELSKKPSTFRLLTPCTPPCTSKEHQKLITSKPETHIFPQTLLPPPANSDCCPFLAQMETSGSSWLPRQHLFLNSASVSNPAHRCHGISINPLTLCSAIGFRLCPIALLPQPPLPLLLSSIPPWCP